MGKYKNNLINITVDAVHFFSFYMAIFQSNENFMNVAIFMAWFYAILCLIAGFGSMGTTAKEKKKSNIILKIYHWLTWAGITLILAYTGYFVTAFVYGLSYIILVGAKQLAMEAKETSNNKNQCG